MTPERPPMEGSTVDYSRGGPARRSTSRLRTFRRRCRLSRRFRPVLPQLRSLRAPRRRVEDDPQETFGVATLALLNALFVAYNGRVTLPEAGMVEERVQRRLAAVLAADVVGYSRLMGEDEEGTLAALI